MNTCMTCGQMGGMCACMGMGGEWEQGWEEWVLVCTTPKKPIIWGVMVAVCPMPDKEVYFTLFFSWWMFLRNGTLCLFWNGRRVWRRSWNIYF